MRPLLERSKICAVVLCDWLSNLSKKTDGGSVQDNFPGPDYLVVKLPLNMGDRELFPDGQFRIYKHRTELKSCSEIFFEQKFHGPPRHVHGGAQAYILDEIMGCTGWMHGFSVVAKTISVEFLRPTPIATVLFGFGEILSKNPDQLQVAAQICDKAGTVFSRSTGVFKILTEEQLKSLAP